MLIQEQMKGPRARVLVQHSRPYDYDEKTGLWHRRVLDEQEAWNIVTDAGRRRIHTYLYGAGGQRAGLGSGLNYIALTNDAAAPAAGDTSLASELTNIGAPGLGRALGIVTLPVGAGTQTTVQNVFTFTAAGPQSVQKTALFDDPSTGTMAHEIQFAQRTLFLNDTITVTFTITLS
jgi:hypothetical protein